MAVPLPYTLQTWVGMVTDNGRPRERTLPKTSAAPVIHNPADATNLKWNFPNIRSHADLARYPVSEAQVTFAANFLLQNAHVKPERAVVSHRNAGLKRYEANLGACLAAVTKEDLKQWMRRRTRFDLEQAAAVVVAAFLTDGRKADAARLVKELGVVLTTSCMWVEDEKELPVALGPLRDPYKLAQKLQINAEKWGI